MASSASYNFTVTRDEIINLAHQHIGALGEGESCTSAQITEASKLLNMIVKLRAADGMPTWALKTAYVLPNNNFFTNVGPDIDWSSNVRVVDDDFWPKSTYPIAGNTTYPLGSTTFTLTANAFVNGDNIGIEQDNGVVHWTTVAGSVGNDVTITVASTAAASGGNQVYGYANADRISVMPLRIIMARSQDMRVNGTVSEMDIYTKEEWYEITDKSTTGIPTVLYYAPYEPYIDKTTANNAVMDGLPEGHGVIHYWPAFQDGKHIIEFQYIRPFADFDSSTDTPDFPQAFHLPLMLELAAMLGPKFGVPMDERKALMAEAEYYREQALTTTYQEGSLYILPDMDEMNYG
jgi:hypothetical protein